MATNPTLLTQPIAANGAKNVIPNTTSTAGAMSQDQGFPAETALPLGAGGVAPSREDFNGAFNLLSGIAFMAQKGFVFNFDDTQNYYVGCVVVDTTDGQKYECIVDAPAGTGEPHETPANWVKFGGSNNNIPVGAIFQYAGNGENPQGALLCDGSAVSRTMYPDLFEKIGTTYGAGDGSTTFNLPNLSDNRFVEGSTTAGTTHSAGLPNIKGTIYGELKMPKTLNTDGVFNFTDISNALAGGSAVYQGNLSIDASLSSSIYSDSVTTVQPKSLTLRYFIQAFDGQTPDSALIDITQYAQELANKANRDLSNLTQTGQDSFLERDFTIIYPNGGTEANPANVSLNTRYVESNPFSGYHVMCIAEIFYDNQWGEAPFVAQYQGGSNSSGGVAAIQLDDGNIVIQTGIWFILRDSTIQGNPFNRTAGPDSTAYPCRVKVWKIGKVASA